MNVAFRTKVQVRHAIELAGDSTFDPDAAQSRLDETLLSSAYPVLTQTVVLKKLAVAP